jgi:hypothetical protein
MTGLGIGQARVVIGWMAFDFVRYVYVTMSGDSISVVFLVFPISLVAFLVGVYVIRVASVDYDRASHIDFDCLANSVVNFFGIDTQRFGGL